MATVAALRSPRRGGAGAGACTSLAAVTRSTGCGWGGKQRHQERSGRHVAQLLWPNIRRQPQRRQQVGALCSPDAVGFHHSIQGDDHMTELVVEKEYHVTRRHAHVYERGGCSGTRIGVVITQRCRRWCLRITSSMPAATAACVTTTVSRVITARVRSRCPGKRRQNERAAEVAPRPGIHVAITKHPGQGFTRPRGATPRCARTTWSRYPTPAAQPCERWRVFAGPRAGDN